VVIDFLGWRAPCLCMQPFDPESLHLFGQSTFVALGDALFPLLYTNRRYRRPFPCAFFARHPYGGVRWTSKAWSVLHPQCEHCWLGLRSLVEPQGAECCVGAVARASQPQVKRFTHCTDDARARVDLLGNVKAHACRCRLMVLPG